MNNRIINVTKNRLKSNLFDLLAIKAFFVYLFHVPIVSGEMESRMEKM